MTIGNYYSINEKGHSSADTTVLKVGGEMYDQEGYRVDVTVWFRHRNENLYYIDSGGNLHGPLDQKHSAKLDNVKKSWESFGRRQQSNYSGWTESQRSRSGVRQWDVRSDINHSYNTMDDCRGRTHSETRGRLGAEIDVLLDDLNRMGREETYTASHYRTTMNRQVGGQPIARWSSLQTGLGRDDSSGRYATTLTRRHVKRSKEPVELLIKSPASASVSRVDLLSVENRQDRNVAQPSMHHRITTTTDTSQSQREQRLLDELLETRKELHELKRTCSMMAEDGSRGLTHASTLKVPSSGGSTMHLNRTSGVPIRTVSQTNVQNYSNNLRNNWISEHNLRDVKQPPIYSTYSAHRENMRMKEQNQTRTSSRHLVGGVGEVVHETISLQPIGPGIHDLETPTTPATLPRVIGGRSNSYSGDIASAYRHPKLSPTLPRTSGKIATERRTRHESTSQWRTATEPVYHPPESSLGSIGGASLAAQEGHMNHVADSFDNRSAIYHAQETSGVWLMPNISKEEAQSMLLSREPGTFLIRTSKSRPNFYVLVLRVPASLDGAEPVRSFLIEHSQMRSGRGDSYHLQGFQTEPTYPTLAAFVHDHTTNRGALPVCLRLPNAGTSYAEGYLHSITSSGTKQGARTMINRSGTGDFNCDVLFLGNSDVFPLENAAAVRRAVEQILINAKNPSKGLKKKCEALVSISPEKTLTIVDKTGLRFQKKTIAGNKIRFCGYDPEERVFNCVELRNRGVVDAQIFAIVVKKTRFAMTEHVVYVMCQLDAHQPSSWLVNYINRNVMGQHR
uniref:Tensin n=1 Tax=Schistocephalus solidus TaxID=70667 RepID=A0A0X3PJH2_SCHSO